MCHYEPEHAHDMARFTDKTRKIAFYCVEDQLTRKPFFKEKEMKVGKNQLPTFSNLAIN